MKTNWGILGVKIYMCVHVNVPGWSFHCLQIAQLLYIQAEFHVINQCINTVCRVSIRIFAFSVSGCLTKSRDRLSFTGLFVMLKLHCIF